MIDVYQTMECLIIIDVQNDFLSEETNARLSRNHIPNDVLVKNIVDVITLFDNYYKPIIFVKSEYPVREEVIEGTHCGRTPCCAKGTYGSQIHPEIMLKVSTNTVITKQWYSAFRETDLDDVLKKLNAKKLYFAGVKTNICVLSTMIDAVNNDYEAVLLEGCTAATNVNKYTYGLNMIRSMGCSITRKEDIEFSVEKDQRTFGEGDCTLFYNVLPKLLSDNVFQKLKDEISWKEMYHKDLPVARLVSVQGTINDGLTPLYRFPNDHYFDLESWTPTMKIIKEIVERRLNHPINHGKIQFYKDGHSYIGPHSDKTLDIAKGSFIINMSFGGTRTFVLKNKVTYEQQKIRLPHNSILMFGLNTNMKWTHGVPKEADVHDERISIVFRNIATFETNDGTVIGQGSKKPNAPAVDEKEEQSKLRMSFHRENSQADFDWNAEYGDGFSVYDFSKL
jgi:nicotinamidase-related amidase/alkylated DNA repair dioxygenase AlkB